LLLASLAGVVDVELEPIEDWSALCCVEVVLEVEFWLALALGSTPAVWLLWATGVFVCDEFWSLLVMVAD